MTQGQGGGLPPTMMMQGFQPGAPPPQQPFGPPPGPAAPPPAAPEKKSTWYYYVGGGCGLLLLSTLCCCGVGGYLAYLEDGPNYSAPGEELTSIPVQSGVPFTVTATWDGTGTATVRAYLDLGSNVQSGQQITGNFACESEYSSTLYPSPVYATYYLPYGDEPPPGWVEISMYNHRRASPTPFRCEGTLEFPPAPGARLVLTVREQRPSEWLDL
jgi:hypothetical protein